MSAVPRMLHLPPGVDPRDIEGKVWFDALPFVIKFRQGVAAKEKQRRLAAEQRRLEDKYLNNSTPKLLRRQWG